MFVTSITLAILALMMVWLGGSIAAHRHKHQISLEDGGDKILLRKIRAFGNFVEYAPLSLAIIAIVEYHQGLVWPLAAMLILARGFHAFSFYQTSGASTHFRFRRLGMILQFLLLIIGAIYLLFLTL